MLPRDETAIKKQRDLVEDLLQPPRSPTADHVEEALEEPLDLMSVKESAEGEEGPDQGKTKVISLADLSRGILKLNYRSDLFETKEPSLLSRLFPPTKAPVAESIQETDLEYEEDKDQISVKSTPRFSYHRSPELFFDRLEPLEGMTAAGIRKRRGSGMPDPIEEERVEPENLGGSTNGNISDIYTIHSSTLEVPEGPRHLRLSCEVAPVSSS